MARKSFDLVAKLLIIGDSGVGKSSLLLRYCDDSFSSHFLTTIGIDFKLKTVNIDGKKVKLQIWDTAGQERFRTITNAYYRGAHGILLVYDVTQEISLQNVKNWMQNIEQHALQEVDRVIVGNKCDFIEGREVDKARGEELAKAYGVDFFETSAKNDTNVTETFMCLATKVVKRLSSKQERHFEGQFPLVHERQKAVPDISCCGSARGKPSGQQQPTLTVLR